MQGRRSTGSAGRSLSRSGSRSRAKGGRIENSELTFGEGLIMVAGADKSSKFPQIRIPRQVGGANTQNVMVYVDDVNVEAHCRRAHEAGASIVSEPKTTEYGEDYWTDRGYECVDIGGTVILSETPRPEPPDPRA